MGCQCQRPLCWEEDHVSPAQGLPPWQAVLPRALARPHLRGRRCDLPRARRGAAAAGRPPRRHGPGSQQLGSAARPRDHGRRAEEREKKAQRKEQEEARQAETEAKPQRWSASRRAASWSRPTSYFSYPNRRQARSARRSASGCCKTIQSTWGGPRTQHRHPAAGPTATSGSPPGPSTTGTSRRRWWPPASAASACRSSRPRPPTRTTRPGTGCARSSARSSTAPATRPRARRSASPGVQGRVPRSRRHAAREVLPLRQGRPRAQVRKISFQTSSNLTYMAWQGQWNQAQVYRTRAGLRRLPARLPPGRLARGRLTPYHVKVLGKRRELLLPPAAGHRRPGPGRCRSSTGHLLHGDAGTSRRGRTKIRVIQYAIYGDRGVWLAKKLRRAVEGRLRRRDHLLGQQPPGAEHPAQPGGARADPDAPVGGQGLLRQHREVQPQQVDDDHRRLGIVRARRTRPSAGRRTGRTSRSATTSRCSGSPASVRRCATTRRSQKTWRQPSSSRAVASRGS